MKLHPKYAPDVVVNAVSFAEFVASGIAQGVPLVRNMPYHFEFQGVSVTHATDEMYLILIPGPQPLYFRHSDVVLVLPDGHMTIHTVPSLFETYEPIQDSTNINKEATK